MGAVLGTLSMTDVLLLTAVGVFICYKIYQRKERQRQLDQHRRLHPQLPPMKKRDLTLEQLKTFDGTGSDKRILIALNGKVFDVTRSTHMYGKEGSYGIFAGRDASRGLALLSIEPSMVKDTYDDLSDLSTSDMDNMREWFTQFNEKYPIVGRLLKPGEEPDVYTESEDDSKQEKLPPTKETTTPTTGKTKAE